MDAGSMGEMSSKESEATSSSQRPTAPQSTPVLSHLTVENVRRLQQEYEAAGAFTTTLSVMEFINTQARLTAQQDGTNENSEKKYAMAAKVVGAVSSSAAATADGDESEESLGTVLVESSEHPDKKDLPWPLNGHAMCWDV